VLGEDEWLAAFNAVEGGAQNELWGKAWFCVHNYGNNHPPNYPNDDVNQKGIPVSAEEYAKYKFSMPFDELNELRRTKSNPGDTVLDDDTTVLRVHNFKKWMTDSLGYCLPMIGGEGGWQWQTEEDLRYPKLPDEFHAAYTREMFEWFRFGKLSDGSPLMDELFCCTAWIQADGQADSWWFGPLGTKQGTIDAVAAIPSYTRKFSWDASAPIESPEPIVIAPTPENELPAPEPKPELPAPDASAEPAPQPSDASATFVYTVQQGETLWGIAKKFGTTIDALLAANALEDRNKIRAGQKLMIPR
jgi:LysM repeat protein